MHPTRRWFITGASSGIGRQLVERALDRGDQVVATVRRADALAELQARAGDALSVELLDLRDLPAIEDVVRRVSARGPVDVVVNNAGYSVIGALEELTADQIDDQLRTLLHGPIALTKAFLPALRDNGGGHIIQISSIGGQISYPGSSVYHAAKWGLEGFTESVATEVAPFGIRFTIVEPGATRTGFARALQFTPELPPYATGPVADLRAYLRTADDQAFPGDPAAIAAVLADLPSASEPPLRLAMGEDSVDALASAFESRAQSLRDNEELSRSVRYSPAPRSG